MNITGIIAEFNPLHKGHIRLLSHAKQQLSSTFVIVAMSGDYMQRGIPAMVNKYERVRYCLAHGADLVIEMPVCGATASAEDFARTGVLSLNATGVVTHLLFGSEHPNMDWFNEAASLSANSSMDYYKRVNELVRSGMNYAAAREAALVENQSTGFPPDFLSGSNNILGIEYVKAIRQFHLTMQPVTIGRDGSAYNDTSLNAGGMSSATAIRHAIHIGNAADTVASLPSDVVKSLRAALTQNEIIRTDDLSSILHYALLKENDFSVYADVSKDLSNKIENSKDRFTTFKEYAQLLKSKDLTYTRVCRCLLHIVLGIRQDDVNDLRAADYAPYLRILGFTKRGSALLKQMKSSARVPFFVSPKEAKDILPPSAANLLSRDIFAEDVYRLLRTNKTGLVYPNAYTRMYEMK